MLNAQLLLTRMDCQEEIAGGEGITDANMLDCLGAIEGKVNEVLLKYRSMGCDGPRDARTHALAAVESPSGDKVDLSSPSPSGTTDLLGDGPVAPMSPEPIYVLPPRLEDDNDEDDNSIARPLTRTELQKLTATRLGNIQQQQVKQQPRNMRATLMGDKKGTGDKGRSFTQMSSGRRGALGQGYSMSPVKNTSGN
mmetsp:Transcript_13258/g.28779  ORF Transcript_13258/g.28779 Transcript_13258/m.28779 type:complete len:195 (+) Transcript_13258:941-1525(+)